MKLVVTMRVLPKIYFSGAENRFSVHTAVREIFGGHFPWERYFFFSGKIFSQERYFFFLRISHTFCFSIRFKILTAMQKYSNVCIYTYFSIFLPVALLALYQGVKDTLQDKKQNLVI